MPNGTPTLTSRNTAVVAAVAFTGFAAVLLAIEALAVRGQLDFAHHVLGLSGAYVYVVPLALEGGTLVSAALALWATLTGDPTAAHRLWTYLFLGGAAAANWLGALAAGRSWVAAAYLAATCVAALRMWHAILHRIQRAELHKAGAVEPPLPRFRVLRWLIAPRETGAAWRLAVREGITSPADALALVRREDRIVPPAAATGGEPDWSTFTTKKSAIEAMAAWLGTFEVKRVREALAAVDIKTDPSTAGKILRDLHEARRRELVHVVPAAVEA